MRIVITSVLLSLVLGACAHRTKTKPETPETFKDESEAGHTDFDKGMTALEREQYKEAARIFENLLVDKPASEKDLVILYNLAASYEGMGNCSKAAERYREVVRSSASRFQNIQGRALYHLSLMYECLGQDAKTITSLLDARKQATELPWATVHAEIPARLAAAYARIGNREKAIEHFKKASEGLKKLIGKEDGPKQTEVLAQTLFLMGQLNPGQRRAEGDATTFMQGLRMQQPYLLQSAELGHPNWSKRAAEDLSLAYTNIWKFKLTDPDKQSSFYSEALAVATELKRLQIPGKSDPLSSKIFAEVTEHERRLRNEMARVGATTKLTPEAQKREGLKRQGKLQPVKKR